MKAAETRASSAIADWTPLTVVCRSCTTYEIDTFISDVSTTRTNIAIARRIARRESPEPAGSGLAVVSDRGAHPRAAVEQLPQLTDGEEHDRRQHADAPLRAGQRDGVEDPLQRAQAGDE